MIALRRVGGVFCLGAALVVACAPAMRGVATLPALPPGIAPIRASQADESVREAQGLFEAREPRSVARARELWRAVAAGSPSRVDALAGIATTSVWLVDHEADADAREEDAVLAVSSARVCTQAAPENAACWYWLGAGLGVQAREKPSTGVSALPEIVKAFERALAIDSDYEEAGPDRALALVFLRAPGWPVGPGDPDRGLAHAEAAIRRRPDSPQNVLALAEARASTDDRDGAVAAYRHALDLAKVRVVSGDREANEWVEQAEAALARFR